MRKRRKVISKNMIEVLDITYQQIDHEDTLR